MGSVRVWDPWLYIFLHVLPWVIENCCSYSRIIPGIHLLIQSSLWAGVFGYFAVSLSGVAMRSTPSPPPLVHFGAVGVRSQRIGVMLKRAPRAASTDAARWESVFFFSIWHLQLRWVGIHWGMGYPQLWFLSSLTAAKDVMHDAGGDPPRARAHQLGPTDWRFIPPLCLMRERPLC